MVAPISTVTSAWKTFQSKTGGIKPPKTEAEYEALLELMQDLTNRYNCNKEPYASLFDLIARYMHEWELDNEPELKLMHLEPFERLRFLMERRNISQTALAKEGIVAQSNLSNILSGTEHVKVKFIFVKTVHGLYQQFLDLVFLIRDRYTHTDWCEWTKHNTRRSPEVKFWLLFCSLKKSYKAWKKSED
jgi:antitoxin component HigA of HigAB toxin-antitoxin module